MSYDQPEPFVFDDAAIAAERRKCVVAWQEINGKPRGEVHWLPGTWTPGGFDITTVRHDTYCGLMARVFMPNQGGFAPPGFPGLVWRANVSFSSAIDCEDCAAWYAAVKLVGSGSELDL